MRFYVNVDHVATVREARRTVEPDPVEAAQASLRGGADGITFHLREDRRHINDDDVRRLAAHIGSPLNMELASAPDIVQLVTELRPSQATFVPERREEVTTEGGLDLASHDGGPDPRLIHAIEVVRGVGVRVSLFIDPDPATIDGAAALQVDAVEFHTGEYANRYPDMELALTRLAKAARQASDAGLAVHAGHGLTTQNVTDVAVIPEVEELSIGHHIVSRSIMVGMEQAVREMREAINGALAKRDSRGQ